MFPTVVSSVTGVLDRRFLRNSFALSLALIVLCVVVALAGAGDLGRAATAWKTWQASTQLLVGLGFIAAVWVVAAVVQSQPRTITQAFEGYWGGPLADLRYRCERRHSERLAALRSTGQVTEIYARYPLSRKQVMATRLGNILRAAAAQAAFARDVVARTAPEGRERAKNLLWAAGRQSSLRSALGDDRAIWLAIGVRRAVTMRFRLVRWMMQVSPLVESHPCHLWGRGRAAASALAKSLSLTWLPSVRAQGHG